MYDEAHLSTPCSYRHAVLKKFAVTTSELLFFVNQEWFYAPGVNSTPEYREVYWVLLAEAHHQQYNEGV